MILGLLASCARQSAPLLPPSPSSPVAPPVPDRLILTPIPFSSLPGWTQDHLTEALPALRRSCDRLMQLPPDRAIGNDGSAGLAGDWTAACGALRWVQSGDEAGLRATLQDWFQPYRVGNGHGDEGRFTGYYEVEIPASRQKTPRFPTPLLTRPRDQPPEPPPDSQPNRAAIEGGALAGKTSVLYWVDPVDAHLLQIQGSGRLILEDGRVVRVGYGGSNGWPFVGIGKILAGHGKITDKTMPAVRAWLKAHPTEAPALMAENPRYVFFRPIPGDGPIGAFNVVLTPGRSLAIDPHFLPLGVPVWLDSVDPDGVRLQKLMVAQDSGKAITGAIRGDYYWGTGEVAFDKAGRMNSHGGYFLLLPQRRSVPVASVDAGVPLAWDDREDRR